MPRKKCLTLEEAFALLQEDDNDEADLVILPPEIDEQSDEEDDDEVLMNDSFLPKDTTELEIHSVKNNDFCDTYDAAVFQKCKKGKRRKIDCTDEDISQQKVLKHEICEEKTKFNWSECKPKYSAIPIDAESSHLKEIANEIANDSPLEIFEKFFDSEVFGLLVEQTNIYAKQKNQQELLITTAYMKRFVGILLLSGYHSLPQEQMYWSLDKDISVPIVRDSMTREKYRNIKRYLHFADNSKLNKEDKLYKVRPYIDLLNTKFQQFGIFHHHLTIDKQMIPYKGKHSAKMYIKGESIRFGYKAWTLASSDGYVYNFDIYSGKSKADEKKEEFGLGGKVALKLLSVIDFPSNHSIFLNDFFMSLPLMCHLKDAGFFVTGSLRSSRIHLCPLEAIETIAKKEKGFFDYRFDEEKEILILRWNGRAVITLVSNFGTVFPLSSMSCYSRVQHKTIPVTQPSIVKEYNSFMGGVALTDNLISMYRINIRGKKWFWPIFVHYIDLALVNAWKICQAVHGNKTTSLLCFRRHVATKLMQTPLEFEEHTSGQSGHPSKLSLAVAVQNERSHFIIKSIDSKRLRCRSCKSQTIYRCTGCQLPLHPACSQIFHKI